MLELSFSAKNVLAGSVMLGLVGGVLGCFAVLRRQSLLGDALAHAALPGVCIGYLLTQSKSPVPLFVGALFAGIAGSVLILLIVRFSRIKEDTAIGIVLSVFFGVGIVLLTYIQKLPFGNQSGLDKYLFGQAASLMPRDVALIGVLGTVVLVVVALFYKELKILAFDPDFGDSLGLHMRRLELLLTLLLVIVVVVGLQTVGVILVIATLINPAAAARQWTERLGVMLVLAGGIGATAGALGALLSARVDRLPTGPAIVVISGAILIVSLVLAPERGLLWAAFRYLRMVARIRRENLLKDLYLWGERHHGDWQTTVPWTMLMGIRGQSSRQLGRVAWMLRKRGLMVSDERGATLSPSGLIAAQRVVRKHRLWETYLTHSLELRSDHVHRDAEIMEHALSDEALADLEERLGYPSVDPHGRPIPPNPDLATPEAA